MADELLNDAIEAENGAEKGRHQGYNQNDQGEKLDVQRRRINKVVIYDVTEAELIILEKGGDASIWLNFFIGSVSIAVSFLVALFTVKWGEGFSLTQIIFICLVIIMSIVSLICLVFWLRGKGQHQRTIKQIKERTIQDNC